MRHFTYVRPESVPAAMQAAIGSNAAFVGGGTNLIGKTRPGSDNKGR